MKSTSKIFRGLLGLFLGWIVLTVSSQAFAQGGTWESKTPMPNIIIGSFSGVIDGKLHVGAASAYPGNDHYVYDPALDTWDLRAPIPTVHHGASVVINRKIYVIAGSDGDTRVGTTNLVEIYDPDTDSWSTGAPMPTKRSGHAATALNGKIYVVGGVHACPPCLPQLQAIEVYDPVSDTWDTTPRALMPTAREQPSAVAFNGKLYTFGGLMRNPSDLNDYLWTDIIEVYDPVTNKWDTTKAPMPTPTTGSREGSVIGGKIHFVGGFDDDWSGITTHEAYDPLTDTWSTLEPIPAPGRFWPMTGVIDGRLYVAGGSRGAIRTRIILP